MSRTFEMSLVFGAVVGGVLSGFRKVSKELKNLKDNTEQLVNTSKKLENFDKTREKLLNLNVEYKKSSVALKKLKEEYERSGKGNKEFANKIKEAEKYVGKLNNQKQKQILAFQRARSAIENEGHNLRTYRDTLNKVNKELETNRKLKEIQAQHEKRLETVNKLGQTGDRAIKRGLVAGALVTAPLKIYMDVEESQADLRKMLGNEAKQYYSALREISDKSPLSQPQVFEIAGALAQSGIAGDDLVEYTKKANQMAVAFDLTTQESGEFLAKTKAQLNLGTVELFKYMDTINYLSDNTASKANEIAEISKRVASLGDMAGVSREGVAAFGATLVSIGKTPEVAATGLKAMYTNLMAGNSATRAQENAFKQLGLDAEKVAKSMVQDGEGTILTVLSRIKELPKHLQASTIKELFGKQAIDSVTGMVNQLDLLETNLDKVKSGMSNGAVGREYAERMNTLGTQLKVAKNQFMNMVANLGEALAPVIKNILVQIKPIIQNISNWIKENPKFTESIMKTVGAFALFNLGLGSVLKFGAPLIKFWSSTITIFQKMKVAGGLMQFFKTVPMLSKLVPLLINPFVLAGAVIIGIFVLLYKKSEWFRNGVNNAVKEIMPYVKELGNLMKNVIGKGIEWINNKMKQAKPHMINVWNALKPILSVVGNIIKTAIIFNIRNTIITIKEMMNNFKLTANVLKGVFGMISSIIVTRIAVWRNIFQIFIAFITGQWNEIPNLVKGIWESIKSGMIGFVEGAKTILLGLFDWFGIKWQNLKEKASNIPLIGGIVGKNYTGTNYWRGGLTTVAERGAELIKVPGQRPFLAQSEMMLNLPKGTQILNNFQTRNSLRDRISGLKDRMSRIGSSNNTSIGGDTINITINTNSSSNPMDIAREVKRALAEIRNKKERTAFG